MTAPIRIQSEKAGRWFRELPEKLADAARKYRLDETPDWGPLSELSSNTRFDGMEAYGDSAVIEGKQNIAPGRVHVELSYKDPEGDVDLRESFPARVFFSVNREKKSVSIERVEVDTTSFFE